MAGVAVGFYRATVCQRYEAWWRGLEDSALSREIKGCYGNTVAHKVFECVTRHSAQHWRQLVAVLERMGTPPTDRSVPRILQGCHYRNGCGSDAVNPDQ